MSKLSDGIKRVLENWRQVRRGKVQRVKQDKKAVLGAVKSLVYGFDLLGTKEFEVYVEDRVYNVTLTVKGRNR